MTIESSLERIAAALEVLSRQAVPTAEAEPVKRGPGRPPKNPPATPPPTAPPTPKPEPEVADAESEDAFLEDEAPPPPKEITIEEVRRALVDYQNRCGKAQLAQKLLKDVGGCETLQALKRTPDKWRAVYDAARKA